MQLPRHLEDGPTATVSPQPADHSLPPVHATIFPLLLPSPTCILKPFQALLLEARLLSKLSEVNV